MSHQDHCPPARSSSSRRRSASAGQLRAISLIGALAAAVITAVGCASMPSPRELDAQAAAMIKAAFRDEGIAKVDRIQQDLAQSACSSDKAPPPQVMQRIMQEAMATVKFPAAGQYLGDWREGERLAQAGRGMTWTDASADPKGNGAQCYNCHQISKAEISYGTIGPSLYQYGKLRGVTDPNSPSAEPILKYTWAKIWNSNAYMACSGMPRFGHAKLLNDEQIRHVMALLLDPKSPVNTQ
ncbi:MAG: sulfur oxidation c-type cytochrome SoxX [Betaproteobacteria bacterium]|nr:sulfur oxidation c-type cytochrome SoxX [Betaproteobacteria bacterium]NBT10446.1 sulfur oxidation c-type cytochrome SoxX [Betaproteobacteria bacterium]NBX97025.1 sulfur oxidation c-type cytochrome SoxX [Betaproteobacteria bacterium]